MVHSFYFGTESAYMIAYAYLSAIGAPFEYNRADQLIELNSKTDPYWNDEIFQSIKEIYDSEVDES